MIGIEFIEDRATLAPDAAFRDRLVQAGFRKGLLVLGCGASSLRLSPPLIVTKEQADWALDTLEACLDSMR
jgi:4-aminobutyrate aminotransferase